MPFISASSACEALLHLVTPTPYPIVTAGVGAHLVGSLHRLHGPLHDQDLEVVEPAEATDLGLKSFVNVRV